MIIWGISFTIYETIHCGILLESPKEAILTDDTMYSLKVGSCPNNDKSVQYFLSFSV